ncbi:MAG: Rieske 2Fe-2S domain-containing protein [Flammeovirgaceae bacterium]|nr:MAG: Rieske 2Fe-2S domain-containing protein [Flammeovirgaceae bacterium]
MEWVKLFADETEACNRLMPDKPQLAIIHGKRICLVQHNKRFFAVQDRCTHNGESLSKGMVNHLGEIICPWHNYCFDLQTGRELAARSADLITYPIKADATGFYVGIY